MSPAELSLINRIKSTIDDFQCRYIEKVVVVDEKLEICYTSKSNSDYVFWIVSQLMHAENLVSEAWRISFICRETSV